ncbi:hypothetical protein DSM110093_00368 [Sulfitobacter sp. DSM 110093]|uniref:hypothetical protein n=1 Tax=Sulfitobacter sp. DSM 110093 TaxID=2883127 RepID=UPI001FAC3991|nr:hypothetical protein [Sulfitobacter sp. DSM 110093]UOA30615.1 hypothetical protein DSM110093_00368 [Sulfitobacter sp. DSM 110093]
MTTYANSLRKLTLTTAVAALMAAPVAAQSLDAGVGSDVSADVAGTEVDANVAAEVEGNLPADQAATGATDVDTALDGSSIAVASDDTVIGTISNVEPQPDGSVRYSIDLSSDLDVDSDRAVVQIDQVVDADGQLAIGMTGEEFAAALTQQMNAGGAAQTQTN